MKGEFNITNLGEPKTYLRIEIERNNETGTLKLHQTKYIEAVLERFGMTDCSKLVKTPIVTNSVYKSTEPNMNVNKRKKKFSYKEALRSLAYLANGTRPDLAYAVN